MENIVILGKTIRQKRLSMNITMDQLAKQVGISRATLSSIENGTGNYSVQTLLMILDALDLSFDFTNKLFKEVSKTRATRLNKLQDKKVNRFVVMCVEQFASYMDMNSRETYSLLKKNGVIKELIYDYEDLHGMSTTYLNEYISSFVR